MKKIDLVEDTINKDDIDKLVESQSTMQNGTQTNTNSADEQQYE